MKIMCYSYFSDRYSDKTFEEADLNDVELWEVDHKDGHSVYTIISSNVDNISDTMEVGPESSKQLEVPGKC